MLNVASVATKNDTMNHIQNDTLDEAKNNIRTIHFIEFHVGNAKQSAFWYCFHFGFRRFAHSRYKGVACIAVQNGPIILVFRGVILPNCDEQQFSSEEYALHGDFVKEICFQVDDIDSVILALKKRNRKIVMEPTIVHDPFGHGAIRIAKAQSAVGSIVHSVFTNIDYNGIFLPGYQPINDYVYLQAMRPINFTALDHIVESHYDGIEDIEDIYKRTLGFVKYWTIDEKMIKAKYGTLNAAIVGTENRMVQLVLTRPGKIIQSQSNKKPAIKGQIQEFLDYNGGPGIQHIAFHTNDICTTVEQMRQRGVEFLTFTREYYAELKQRLASAKFEITENINQLEKLNILVDFDENGYLLQIFTKPIQDRPTLFIEIIERHNFVGFGAGNFKALFAAVEQEQQYRHNEFPDPE